MKLFLAAPEGDLPFLLTAFGSHAEYATAAGYLRPNK
jgi:hypothetical protein